ncbi:MAG: SatD family protein [Kosmotogaceae bacterium]
MGSLAVITADIVKSREKDILREKITSKIDKFDCPELAIPFSVSRGDELQGVIEKPHNIAKVIRKLRYFVKPLKLHVGVGIGEIDKTELQKARSSWDLNGNTFIKARDALDIAKKNRLYKTVVITGDKFADTCVNTIFLLLDSLESEWTEKQWEAVHTYESAGTYEKASKRLGSTIQNIQQHCSSAKWSVIREAEEKLELLLKELPEEQF